MARSVVAAPDSGLEPIVFSADSAWAERDLETWTQTGRAEQGEGGAHRPLGVIARAAILEDRHHAVARGVADVAVGVVDMVQEIGEVALQQVIHHGRRQGLAEPGVAADVQEQDRDPAFLLGQFRGVGIGGNQAFHGFGHELGQVIFDPT